MTLTGITSKAPLIPLRQRKDTSLKHRCTFGLPETESNSNDPN